MTYYVLVDREPVETDMMTWARQHQDIEQRRVDETAVDADVWVSTVFLGTDHRFFGDGPPVLYETMVFRSGDGQECWRYCTWSAAQAGHDAVVVALREGRPLSDLEPPMGGVPS